MLDHMVPDVAQSRISRRQDRSVPQLHNHACTVSESAVVPVVDIFCAVRFHLHQSVSVGTHPQMILRVHHHASDPDAVETSGHVIPDPVHPLQVHRVHSLIRSEIVCAVPLYNGIGYPVFHSRCGIDIPEIGCGQPQQAQSGGGKPQVALVVHHHVVNGIVEFIGIDSFIRAVRLHVGDAVVRADEEPSVIQEVKVLDGHQARTFNCAFEIKPAFADIKTENFVA